MSTLRLPTDIFVLTFWKSQPWTWWADGRAVASGGSVGMLLEYFKIHKQASAEILVLQFYIDTRKKIN